MGGGRGSLKVSVVSGGGFAGLVMTTSVDSAVLAPEDAATLRAKVRAARLDEPPATDPTRQPDAPTRQITVEDDGRRSTVNLDDRDLSPAVRSLISWIEAQPTRQETIEPPG
jgi:hypothetical protein